MIYRPEITEEGFKRFNNIPEPYWACGWVIGETEARLCTNADEAISPPNFPNGPAVLDGVATLVSDGWQYFLDVVAAEGITIPDEVLNN